MDSITQIALGATVAEVTIGKKVGNKAILWGSVFGTLPDLDVLLNGFYSEVAMLGIHRGMSHSLFFATVSAPLFGLLLRKIHKNTDLSVFKWSLMVFLVLITHVLLDSLTVYGTQLLAPFSNYPVGFNSLFIIDPIYTLPMLAAVIISLFLKNNKRKYNLSKYALILSTSYAILSIIFKLYTLGVFQDNLEKNNINYDKHITMATPVNIVMFSSIALENDTLYVSQYSIFDKRRNLDITSIPRNSYLLNEYMDSEAVKKLLWFSKGYYHVWNDGDNLYLSDLRFGRSDFWLDQNGSYIFNFKLLLNENDEIYSFKRETPSFKNRKGMFSDFFNRILGK